MNVELRNLFVSSGHDFVGRHGKEALDHGKEDREEISCVAGRGIEGDRYFDHQENYKGQITFFDHDVYEAVKEQFSLPDLHPFVFRRNVLISGIDLNALIGKKFAIGEIEFEGSEEAKPCYWMDKVCTEGVEDYLRGKGGLRARILRGGILGRGSAELRIC